MSISVQALIPVHRKDAWSVSMIACCMLHVGEYLIPYLRLEQITLDADRFQLILTGTGGYKKLVSKQAFLMSECSPVGSGRAWLR